MANYVNPMSLNPTDVEDPSATLGQIANQPLTQTHPSAQLQQDIDTLSKQAAQTGQILGQGVGGASPIFNSLQGLQRGQNSLGMDNVDSLNQALALRNARNSGNFVGELQRNIALQAPASSFNELQQAAQGQVFSQNIALSNYEISQQQQMNQQEVQMFLQQQQNSILGGVLGLLGAIGGGIIGGLVGGPPGAAAGAAAGGKL